MRNHLSEGDLFEGGTYKSGGLLNRGSLFRVELIRGGDLLKREGY